MSIQTEINRLNTAKTDILKSISNKGVDTSKASTLSDVSTLIDNISTSEDLTNEFNDYETYLSEQETTIDDIILALQNKSAGSSEVAKNIFSNDYSQIGYSGVYIKETGYTPNNVLWSDITPYTGQTATWYVTNPIEIKANTQYKYEGFNSANNPGCCFLGEDETTIYNGFVYKGEGSFTTPENAKYIVMSVASAYLETMSIKEMTEAEIIALEMDMLVNRTITKYSNDTLTSIGSYSFYGCSKLTSVSLNKATSIGISAFNACSNMVNFEAPLVTSFTTQSFYACNSLTSLSFPVLKTIGAQGARACKKLARVDLGTVTSIGALSFDGCSLLDTVIVRTTSVPTLINVSAFSGTLIASGTGYIYVNDTLVENFKTASNWSTYSEQIKPLSELEE